MSMRSSSGPLTRAWYSSTRFRGQVQRVSATASRPHGQAFIAATSITCAG